MKGEERGVGKLSGGMKGGRNRVERRSEVVGIDLSFLYWVSTGREGKGKERRGEEGECFERWFDAFGGRRPSRVG